MRHSTSVTAIRFPKDDVGEHIPAIKRRGVVDVDVLAAPGLSHDVLLVPVGAFATLALAVAELLRNQGIGVTVVDPRWVLPVPESIGELAQSHKLVITVEDNGVHGGVGSSVSAALRSAETDGEGEDTPVNRRAVRSLGVRKVDLATRGPLRPAHPSHGAARKTPRRCGRPLAGWRWCFRTVDRRCSPRTAEAGGRRVGVPTIG